jgi:hypothetical protein
MNNGSQAVGPYCETLYQHGDKYSIAWSYANADGSCPAPKGSLGSIPWPTGFPNDGTSTCNSNFGSLGCSSSTMCGGDGSTGVRTFTHNKVHPLWENSSAWSCPVAGKPPAMSGKPPGDSAGAGALKGCPASQCSQAGVNIDCPQCPSSEYAICMPQKCADGAGASNVCKCETRP